MSRRTQAVATLAASAVQDRFGTGTGIGFVRLQNFSEDELAAIASELKEWASGKIPVVALAEDRWDGLPEYCEVSNNATAYRNDDSGCIYLVAREFSDSQGLSKTALISDGNLLGKPTSPERALCAFRSAWRIARNTADVPKTVSDVVETLLEVRLAGGKAGESKPISLRQWLSFALSVCAHLPAKGAIDGATAREAVGKALPSLEMFTDTPLRDIDGSVPLKRRLERNFEIANWRQKSGRELDADELLGLVDKTHFRDEAGEPLRDREVAQVREQLKAYLLSTEEARREEIELRHWLELLDQTVQKRGLGTRIREYLEATSPDRLREFEELDVEDGLNVKQVEAARELLEAEAEDSDAVALADLLTTSLRKAVERIANPTARSTDQPLRHLLKLIYQLRDDVPEGARSLRLEIRPRHGVEPSDQLSRALFALLFGRTLRAVAERTEGSAWGFVVDPSLLDTGEIASWLAAENGEATAADEPEEPKWDDLRLQLRWDNEDSGSSYFEWRPRELPGLVGLGRLLVSPDEWCWRTADLDFDAWCVRAMESGNGLGACGTDEPYQLVEEWLEERKSAFEAICADGLSHDNLMRYVEFWKGLLERANAEFVPEGASFPEIGQFLSVDLHIGPGGSPTMLATHPLRIRWIAEHLARMVEALVDVVTGAFKLNVVNDDFYFARLGQSSPHEQPPFLCDDANTYVAVREVGWHERFDLAKTRDTTHTDWLADLDDASLQELADAVGRYIDAHPHKADGIDLLVVTREKGARTVRTLLHLIRRQSGPAGRRTDTRITLHVVCPRRETARVAAAVTGEEFDHPEDRISVDFPRVRVLFHEWEAGAATPNLEGLDPDIDVAVVPNLFSARSKYQERTTGDRSQKGVFDPWIDRPTMKESAASGKSVSRVLLPDSRDDMLEQWSTVNVRHSRGTRVGAEEGEGDIDFATLLVSVQEGEDFFAKIHEIAQWVVTLDAFVGREQVEALESRPDVISVKPGLGKGGTYTLVVSSKAGRDFVVRRLARRLQAQLGATLEVDALKVAAILYERARELAPGTLLRALGLGRTAQEIVGLVVSRRLVDEFDPWELDAEAIGFESWTSLDEHVSWFSGSRNSRADLIRLRAWRVGTTLRVRLTVVEAKLRAQSAVRKADEQVKQSVELCSGAFAGGSVDEPKDAEFWRRELVQAIRDSNRSTGRETSTTLRSFMKGQRVSELPEDLLAQLRDGDYELDAVDGIVCTVGEPEAEEDTKTPSGHRWIRASRAEIAAVLRKMAEGTGSVPVKFVRLDADEEVDEGDLPGDKDLTPEAAGEPEHGDARELGPPPHRGLSETELDSRYQKVLDVFAEYGPEVQADDENPAQEGPGFFIFRVVPGAGVLPSAVRKRAEELQLKLGLGQGQQVRSYIDREAVVFEVPKAEEDRYWVWAQDLWARVARRDDALATPIGEDVHGNAVELNFSSSKTPHLLVGGITGSGKSVALETILRGLVERYSPEQLRLALVDPKGVELVDFEDCPHLEGEISMFAEDAIEILEGAVVEMNRRYVLMKDARVKSIQEYNAADPETPLPWWVIVLDEYADLTAEPDERKQIEKSLQRLAQKARAAGIHVIVATQKPSAQVISTEVRSNLGAQLALRVKTKSDSSIIMDESGAETLAGNGDAFLKRAGAEPVRLQCAMVKPPQA